MKKYTSYIILVMIMIPLLMFVYLTGVNKGVTYTAQSYNDSINQLLNNTYLGDTQVLNINDLKTLNLNVSDFDLQKFKVNNGFDLKEIYKDNIEFYNLDTMDIDKINFNELDFLCLNVYLADLDTVTYDSYYVILASTQFTKIISLYNSFKEDEYIRSNDDLYKISKMPVSNNKDKAIDYIYKLRIRGKKMRMMILK